MFISLKTNGNYDGFITYTMYLVGTIIDASVHLRLSCYVSDQKCEASICSDGRKEVSIFLMCVTNLRLECDRGQTFPNNNYPRNKSKSNRLPDQHDPSQSDHSSKQECRNFKPIFFLKILHISGNLLMSVSAEAAEEAMMTLGAE